MTKHLIALAMAASLTLTACAEDKCASASNPAECRAWTDAGGDIDDYLMGGMIGYMLANRGGQPVIVRDPGYHGSYRPLRRPLPPASVQVQRLKAKVERQRAELRRQQAANAAKKTELRAWRSSSSSSSRSSSSFRSSSFRGGRR